MAELKRNMEFIKAQRRTVIKEEDGFSVRQAKEHPNQISGHKQMCIGYTKCIYGCEHPIVVTF